LFLSSTFAVGVVVDTAGIVVGHKG